MAIFAVTIKLPVLQYFYVLYIVLLKLKTNLLAQIRPSSANFKSPNPLYFGRATFKNHVYVSSQTFRSFNPEHLIATKRPSDQQKLIQFMTAS